MDVFIQLHFQFSQNGQLFGLGTGLFIMLEASGKQWLMHLYLYNSNNLYTNKLYSNSLH